jgi:hypothetical protein
MKLNSRCAAAVALRAKPKFLCPQKSCAVSPLPVGRVDLDAEVSGYSNSGFAVVGAPMRMGAQIGVTTSLNTAEIAENSRLITEHRRTGFYEWKPLHGVV